MVRIGSPRRSLIGASLVALFLWAVAMPASAQNLIKRPGAHPDYGVELEPHLVLQWSQEPRWVDDVGVGLGFRAAIPIMDNGPIKTINNNMAIGFGIDWAHFSDCRWWWGRRPAGWRGFDDCSGNAINFPVYVQWNFFFTDVISVFGETGFGIQYEHVKIEGACGPNFADVDCRDTDVEPVFIFQGGARFLFGETAGLLLRVGVPYVTIGASILL